MNAPRLPDGEPAKSAPKPSAGLGKMVLAALLAFGFCFSLVPL